jgi:2-polyprenyl-3-methyl-5-hydroxy-6-metoxy-1,4-benzoquinol methylase
MSSAKMKIVKNSSHGQFEVENKPSEEELTNYYANKYYQQQENKTNKYKKSYTEEELSYLKNKISQKFGLASELLSNPKSGSFIDVGCGEGHSLNFFHQLGWDVTGVDFSSNGIETINPQMKKHFVQGNIEEVIKRLGSEGEKYDVVWLDNVLEHVLNAKQLLMDCYDITKTGGAIVIEVPNDFSKFQDFLTEKELVDKKYWVATPDHLSYFSPDSLVSIAQSAGWGEHKIMTDFPIELFLTNPNSNYVLDKQVGKGAHHSRLAVENYLANNNSVEKVNSFYKMMLEMGMGRQLIAAFKKST